MALTAITQNYLALNYIPQILQNDVDFILKMVRIHSTTDITPHIQHFKAFNNPDFISEAVYLPNISNKKIRKCRVILKHLSPALLDLLYKLI